MKIVIINGPNLNLLGTREPEIYGSVRFEDYLETLKSHFPKVDFEYFQSNEEGVLVSKIQDIAQQDVNGMIINAAAYSHTSIALADAVAAISVPVVEVHISNIFSREPYRRHTYISEKCVALIAGMGLDGYTFAAQFLINSNKKS